MSRGRLPGEDWLLVFTSAASRLPEHFHPDLDDCAELVDDEARLFIPDGTPVLVSPDYDIDPRLVEYCARSIEFTEQAKSGRATYAEELRSWLAFLWSQNLAWDEATERDYANYKRWRTDASLQLTLSPDRLPRVVSDSTVDKAAAALAAFYKWAEHRSRRYVDVSPIPERRRTGRGRAQPGASSRKKSRGKWFTPRTMTTWRDVGLLGYQLAFDGESVSAGEYDESWRGGRNMSRNRAYFDLALTSALRRREIGSLLVTELPSASTDIALSRAVSKRNRERMWTPLPEPLDEVAQYMEFAREAAIGRAQAEGRYDSVARPVIVSSSSFDARSGGHLLEVEGGSLMNTDDADEDLRMRLFTRDPERPTALRPMSLWLRDSGLPMAPKGWDGVFERANVRMAREHRRLGLPDQSVIYVHPHTLRFSFALYLLAALHRRIDSVRGRSAADAYDETLYEMAFDTVRDVLGHASVTITKDIYLEPVKGLRRALLVVKGDAQRDLSELIDRLATASSDIVDTRMLTGGV